MVAHRRIGPDGGFIREFTDVRKRVQHLETRPSGNIVIRETMETTDPVTGVKTVFGALPDGTFGIQPFIFDITPPPVATAPTVSVIPGIFSVSWDGLFVNNGVLPRDFECVNIIGHKMNGAATVSSAPLGAITRPLDITYITQDVCLVGEYWQFSLESEDYNGNRAEWSARSATVRMESVVSDAGVTEALEALQEAADAAALAAQAARDAADDAQDDADAVAASLTSTNAAVAAAQLKADQAFNNAASASTAAGEAQTTASGKNRNWYIDTPPTGIGHKDGDQWFDTNDGNRLYLWKGEPDNQWVNFQDAAISAASQAATGAQASADGKSTNYYEPIAPTNVPVGKIKKGDTWYDTANGYRLSTWSGTAWQTTQDMAAALLETATKSVVYTQNTTPPVAARLPQTIWNDTSLGLDKIVVKVWIGSPTNAWTALADKAATEARSTADAKSETIYSDTAPSVAQRLPQNLWIDTTGGININKRWDGSGWVVVVDSRIPATATAVTAADGKAQTALDTALAKGTIYTQAFAPPVEARLPQNLWVDTSLGLNNSVTKYWNGAWTAIADKVATDAATLAGTKSQIIYGATAPTGVNANVLTLWIDTTGGANTPKKWVSGTTWAAITDKVATDAAALAATKGKVLIQSDTPAAADQLIQNLWIDTTAGVNIPKRWNTSGNSWDIVTDKTATDAAAAASAAQTTANTAVTNAATADSKAVTAQTAAGTASSAASAAQTTANTAVTNAATADSKAAQALADALAANNLAVSKGKVLYQTSAPTGVDANLQTLWIDTTSNLNTPKRWISGTTWNAVTDKVATDAASLAATKGKIIYSTTAPTGLDANLLTLWIDTTGNANTPKKWVSGTTWQSLTDKVASDAAALAATKGKILFQTTAPTGADASLLTLWIDTTGGANTPKKWVSGTTWTAITDKVALDAAQAAAAAALAASGAQGTADTAVTNAATAQTLAQQAFNNAALASTAAGTAQLAADGKSTVWNQDNAPAGTGHRAGDLWFDTNDGNKPYVWVITGTPAWTSARDATIATAQIKADTAFTIANGKTTTYYQDAQPSGGTYVKGDMWFDTNDGNKPYVHNGTIFVVAQDAAIFEVQPAVTTAISNAANGKNKVVYSTLDASGTGYVAGDTWFKRDGAGTIIAQWEFTTSWQSRTINEAVIGNLSAGKIVTGTLDADRLGANTISVEKLLVGSFDNVISDPSFLAGNLAWPAISSSTLLPTGGLNGAPALRLTGNSVVASLYNKPQALPVDGGASFKLSTRFKTSAALAAGSIWVFARWRNAAGTYTYTDVESVLSVTGVWTDLTGLVTGPADAVSVSFAVSIRANVTAGQYVDFDFVSAIRAANGKLIVDGAITAGSAIIGNAAIGNAHIADIHADKITAGTVAAARLDAETIKAKLIDASLIDAVDILVSGSITAANGIIGSIDASKISVGTLAAARIGAKSITVDKLLVSSSDSLIVEGDFGGSGASWELPTNFIINATAGRNSLPAMVITNTASLQTSYNAVGAPTKVAIETMSDVANAYRITGWVKTSVSAPANSVLLNVRFRLSTGSYATLQSVTYTTGTPAVATIIPANTWVEINGMVTAPANTISVAFSVSTTSALATGTTTFDMISATRASSGELIVDGAIDGKTITGALIQTIVTASRGIKLTSTELAGYDASGVKNFSLTSAGALTIKGDITSGSTITGARLTGTGIETSATALSGVKLSSSGITAYNSSNELTFRVDAATGLVEAPGLKANTIKGDMIDAGTISASKLIIGAGDNLIPDPGYQVANMTAMRNSASTMAVSKNVTTGNLDLVLPGTGNYYLRPTGIAQTAAAFADWLPVSPGESYLFSATISTSGTGDLRFTGRTKDGSATSIAFSTLSAYPTIVSGVRTYYKGIVPADCYWMLPEIRLSGWTGTATIAPNAMSLRQMATGELIVDGAIDGKTITGALVQTEATASRGIKLTSAELAGYDGAGVKNLSLTSAGVLTLKGAIETGSTITGATMTGSTVQTSATALSGIKMASTGIKAYDAGNNLTFHLDATTGLLEVPGIKSNAITGDLIAANTITADKVIISGSNLHTDPEFRDTGSWFTDPGITFSATGGRTGGAIMTIATNSVQTGAYYATSSPTKRMPVVSGGFYRVSVWVKGSVNIPIGGASIYLRAYKPDNTWSQSTPTNISNTSIITSGVWTEISGTFEIPAGYTQATAGLYKQSLYTTGTTVFSDLFVQQASSGVLIVNGAITTNHMTSGTIDAGVLTAGSITGLQIKAGTISAQNMLVTSQDNLVENGGFEYDFTQWSSYTAAFTVDATAGRLGGKALKVTGITARNFGPVSDAYTAIENANDQFRLSGWIKTTATTGHRAELCLYYYNAGGTLLSNTNYNVEPTGNVDSTGTVASPPGIPLDSTWRYFSKMFQPPATAAKMRVRLNSTMTSSGNTMWFDDISLVRAAGGSLIVDGGILTQHMTSGTIDAGVLTAGSITGTKIAAKSIAVDNLVVSSTDNLIVESNFEHPTTPGSSWTRGTNQIIQPTGGRSGAAAMRLTGTTSINYTYNLANKVTVDADNRFRVSMWVKTNVAYATDKIRFGIKPWSGTTLNTNVALFRNSSVTTSPAYVPGTNTWTQISGITDALPAGTTAVEFFINCSSPSTSAYVDIDSVAVTRAADGNLVVDGAIDGKTITGALIQTTATADLGVKLDGLGLRAYDPAGNTVFDMSSTTGNVLVTGKFQTGDAAAGIIMDSSIWEGKPGLLFLTGTSEELKPVIFAAAPTSTTFETGALVLLGTEMVTNSTGRSQIKISPEGGGTRISNAFGPYNGTAVEVGNAGQVYANAGTELILRGDTIELRGKTRAGGASNDTIVYGQTAMTQSTGGTYTCTYFAPAPTGDRKPFVTADGVAPAQFITQVRSAAGFTIVYSSPANNNLSFNYMAVWRD